MKECLAGIDINSSNQAGYFQNVMSMKDKDGIENSVAPDQNCLDTL